MSERAKALFDGPKSIIKVEEDMVLSFLGQGEATFNVMHTGGLGDAPDPFGWSEVMDVSTLKEGEEISGKEVFALARRINGDKVVIYRKCRAEFLSVTPIGGAYLNYVVHCTPLSEVVKHG